MGSVRKENCFEMLADSQIFQSFVCVSGQTLYRLACVVPTVPSCLIYDHKSVFSVVNAPERSNSNRTFYITIYNVHFYTSTGKNVKKKIEKRANSWLLNDLHGINRIYHSALLCNSLSLV